MPRLVHAVVWLVVCLVSPLRAQSEGLAGGPAADSADVLVLDHDFTAGIGEFVRVFLQAKQVYRAELSSPDVTIAIRTSVRSRRPPRVYPLMSSDAPSGGSVAEIYADEDGEYELQAVDFRRAGVATRLRLYRDARESRRRMAIIDKPGWEVGIEIAGGWHSGYDQRSSSLPTLQEGDAGSDLEACFAARNAPDLRRISICALGVGWGSQHGARSTLWVYSEPRLGILGKFEPGRSNWEIGASFRVAIGSISRSSETPVMLAPGIYITRHIRTNAAGAGWSMRASYSYGIIRGTPKALDDEDPTTKRLLLGFGWYR